MDALRHVLTAAVLALVLRWLWKSSSIEKAREESGRKIFPPTRAIRIVMPLTAVLFTAMVILSSMFLREPRNWWVPYFFLGFALLPIFAYPPVLTIEVDGVASRAWFGREKKIRWEEIASLHYNTGNKQFTVRASDGRKITHGGFNADANLFRQEIQRRTRLPLKVAQPGVLKAQTVEVPYQEVPDKSNP
jgi:Bacterial PH domain